MSNSKIILTGYSGHGFVVADAALEQGLNLLFYTEINEVKTNPYNLEYLGKESDPNFKYWEDDFKFALGIGDNSIRRKAADLIISKGKELVNVLHPRSWIAKSVKMGNGNFVNACGAVNSMVVLGSYCIVNTGAIVEHECHLGDAIHVAPGAVLAGGVKIGDNSFVGANSVVKEGVKIGKNVLIGAGSVILKDVPDNTRIVGNPGRKI